MNARTMPMVSLRAAQAADEPALYAIHRAAMRDVVERAYGAWEEPFQQRYFHEHLGNRPVEIVMLADRAVGILTVVERDEEIFVDGIELAPEVQGAGIGTALLRGVLRRGRDEGKPVALRVFKVNRAFELYKRLGFRVTTEDDKYWYLRSDPRVAGEQ
jgi:ribosomal protein S18 acetylase RimI-like enzyme